MNDRRLSPEDARSRGTTSGWGRIIFSGTIGAAIGMVLILIATRFLFPDADYISVKLPNGESVEIAKSDEGIDFSKMLDSLFADSFAKEGAVCWLRDKKQLYHVDDPKLTDCLAEILPERPPGDSSESVVDQMKRLNDLIEQHKVVKDLRQRAEKHEPPFQYVGKIVQIGVPDTNDQPRQFRVNVPNDSEFEGKRIKIENPYDDKFLILEGRPAFAKTSNVHVDIQLNQNQATYLFRRVISTTECIATILPAGGILKDWNGASTIEKPFE